MARFYRVCDRCGFDRDAADTVLEWTGLIVCRDCCLDERNPQDFVRGRRDLQTVPDPRPEPDPYFVSVNEVTHGAFGDFGDDFGNDFPVDFD